MLFSLMLIETDCPGVKVAADNLRDSSNPIVELIVCEPIRIAGKLFSTSPVPGPGAVETCVGCVK